MEIANRPAKSDPIAARDARYASAFGCIRCGCTIFEYCFVEGSAKGSGLFLLCPDCKNRLNAMEESAAILTRLRRQPALCSGLDRKRLPYVSMLELPDTEFPSGEIRAPTVFPVVLGEQPLIGVVPPETIGAPLRLDVTLGAGNGVVVPLVRSNEWVAPAKAWHLAFRAGRFEIASKDGESSLVLAFSHQRLRIERLVSRWLHYRLGIDANGLRFAGAAIELPAAKSGLIGVQIRIP